MAKQNWKPGNMLYPLPAVIRWKTEFYYRRVGWHSLHQSADGFDFRPPGALLIPPD